MQLSYNELIVVEIVEGEPGITMRRLIQENGQEYRSAIWDLLHKGILEFNDMLKMTLYLP